MRRSLPGGQEGYTLMAVVVFALVLTIAGASFFAMASYETGNAMYRQNSSEAFYLADAGIEHVRAKFLDNVRWFIDEGPNLADSFPRPSGPPGFYQVTVVDSSSPTLPRYVEVKSVGYVQNAVRGIRVMARVPASGLGLTMLVMGDADVGGNLCLTASAHVNGDADFGPHDAHLACDGTYTTGFRIDPPAIYTEPDRFPGATYYYVKGNQIGTTYQARIFDGFGNDITTALGDSLDLYSGSTITTFAGGRFVFTFDSDAEVEHYFDDLTGIFKRNPGDVAAVVNFGEPPLVTPPGPTGVADVVIDAQSGRVIHTTIINTRFLNGYAAPVEERYETTNWTGGKLIGKQAIFEPYYGVAVLTHDFQKQGGALVAFGTAAWPALVYVTQDVTDVNSNFQLTGSLICLRDWDSTGGPDLVYNGQFIPNLPDYLEEDWPQGSSGTMQISKWEEFGSASVE